MCRKCGKVGHIQRVCRSGKSQNSSRQRKKEIRNLHAFEVNDERDGDSLVPLLEANNVNQMAAGDVIWKRQKMEFDTGSAISTLPLCVEHNTQVKDLTLCVVKAPNACIVWKRLATPN